MYSFGDILIINFPFSDAQGSKRRPAMVIKDTNDQDILIAKITSQLRHTEFDIALQNWAKGKFNFTICCENSQDSDHLHNTNFWTNRKTNSQRFAGGEKRFF